MRQIYPLHKDVFRTTRLSAAESKFQVLPFSLGFLANVQLAAGAYMTCWRGNSGRIERPIPEALSWIYAIVLIANMGLALHHKVRLPEIDIKLRKA